MSKRSLISLIGILFSIVILCGVLSGIFLFYINSSSHSVSSFEELEQIVMCSPFGGKECATCDDYPKIDEVENTLSQYSYEVEQIENINPRHIYIEAVTDFLVDCDDEGRIEIYYETENDKKEIMKYLDNSPNAEFHGIKVVFIQR